MSTSSRKQRFQQAVNLVQQGKRAQAAQIFAGIVSEEPRYEAAWLWLAGCVNDPQQQRYCLERALKINPANLRARRALSHLPAHAIYQAQAQNTTSIPRTGGAMVFDMPTQVTKADPTAEGSNQEPAPEVRRARRGSRGWIIVFILALLALAAFFFIRNGWLERFGIGAISPSRTDLAERIRSASSGEIITLGKGVFTLQEAIIINNAITLQGAGVDETQLTVLGGGGAILLESSGEVAIQNLSILYDGETAADVIVVQAGSAALSDCRIAGGRWDPEVQAGGRGLVIEGTSTGKITRCEFVNNDTLGIEIREQAHPTITESLVHQNRGGGLGVSGSAQPLVEKNIVRENGQSGLIFSEMATGKVVRNEITDNTVSGIEIFGQAEPLILENTVIRNLEFGAQVSEISKPMLLSNSFLQNGKAGIAYFQNASGAAQDNDCSENEMHGISINDDATPFLQENRCERNLQVGIDYWGNSGGTAANNETSENGLQGIALHEEAHPTLENNISNRNNDSGIIFWGASGGTARNNNCSENRLNGISVHADAQPVILGNTCRGNSLSGIAYYDRAGGTARSNHCIDNVENTILVVDQAKPELSENLCTAR